MYTRSVVVFSVWQLSRTLQMTHGPRFAERCCKETIRIVVEQCLPWVSQAWRTPVARQHTLVALLLSQNPPKVENMTSLIQVVAEVVFCHRCLQHNDLVLYMRSATSNCQYNAALQCRAALVPSQ